MRMNGITLFFDNLFSRLASLKFAHLAIAEFCVFGALFLATLICCIFSQRMRMRSKRPFMCAVNLFTALTLAVFAAAYALPYAAAVAAAFWCIGYMLYGLISLFNSTTVKEVSEARQLSAVAYRQNTPQLPAPLPQPAVHSKVRLEHALSITEKLLQKNVGRGDRQELERIKNSLVSLKVKEMLTPQEGEQLNDMFNSLLKLMAKYDL